MEIIESFQALKNLADRTFRNASLGYQDVQKPEMDVAERSVAMRSGCGETVPLAASRAHFILRRMTFVSSGRSNHVCYGPIATELVHHNEMT